MITLWMVLCIALAGGQETQPIRVTGAADLAGWSKAGAVRIAPPALKSGDLADLFDGDPSTLVRCGDEKTAVFAFAFNKPFALRQVGIIPGGSGVYRWQVLVPEQPGSGSPARFIPLFPWRFVKSNQRDPLPVPGDLLLKSFRLVVERLTLGDDVVLNEIECYTPLELVVIRMEGCPEQARVGVPFRPRPVALDRFGGRIVLGDDARLSIYPASLLQNEDGLLTPLSAGKVHLGFSLGRLRSDDRLLTIMQCDPAPSEIQVEPFNTTAVVRYRSGSPSCRFFGVHARRDGEPVSSTPEGITEKPDYTVTGLEPGKVYHFSVVGLDQARNQITPRSSEVRLRMPEENAHPIRRVASIDLLIPLYTEKFSDEELEAIVEGFEAARLFIFRSARTRLDLALHVVKINGEAPISSGGGMEAIEDDLEARGLLGWNTPLVHVVSKNLTQNRSGFRFKNGSVGSQGFLAEKPWPDQGPPLRFSACWTLVHEIQHSLEAIVAESATSLPMLCGHFLDNYPLPAGEVFDAGDGYAGQREIFRRYQGYFSLPNELARVIEVNDQDTDGMPDDDSRLPFDEARLGSDPQKPDTDLDGLNDLHEFCAGLYSAADPCKTDSDGDDIPDGSDPYPLSCFAGAIPFGTPNRGEFPQGLLSQSLFFSSNTAPPAITAYASWDNDYLYLAFQTDRACRFFLHLDGSGHLGPFESDRAISLPEGANLPGNKTAGDVYTRDAVLTLAFGSPHLVCGSRIVPGAQVISAERDKGKRLWIAVPARLGPGTRHCHIRKNAETGSGLCLAAGRILGMAITVVPLDAGADIHSSKEFEAGWSSLFETHCFYDALLLPPE